MSVWLNQEAANFQDISHQNWKRRKGSTPIRDFLKILSYFRVALVISSRCWNFAYSNLKRRGKKGLIQFSRTIANEYWIGPQQNNGSMFWSLHGTCRPFITLYRSHWVTPRFLSFSVSVSCYETEAGSRLILENTQSPKPHEPIKSNLNFTLVGINYHQFLVSQSSVSNNTNALIQGRRQQLWARGKWWCGAP